ncbi:hypothetical protein SARC_10040 [Sphaeroforma arctica JP610]|uniref:Uncharacterized protein n=1 Tax=Sphaeroforma arctica JP610 TaxID=667725 RepID=A0A0L0FL32_9EUKA|nr:hypothetical protein SARC_10040 [Sphaeroforma arctica JP610]KNC77497.1 hypothetical protein SARC_10040 [Sphaeroforma arctica JP610]|eukprot:XP_014151399.1 hypothetical protein SARC_10040 [Sphaeroforma arctica JP610]
MKNVNVPNLYMPETSDVYNQRNMPKVISCIFALSHILYQNGMAPKIQNLVGKVEFSDDDISAIQTALVRYGVKLPQFSTVGGQLAKELSSDLAGMHAAILAINQTVDKQVTADTLDALKITKAHIDHVQECYGQAYQEMLWRARTAKRHKSSEAMSASQNIDVYLTNLTQCEIQHVIDDVNHDKALGEINAAIIISDALTLQTALENHHAMVRGTRPHMANIYLTKLQQVRSTALNLKTIQKIISQVNQNTEETQKELKRLQLQESAVAVQAAVRLQAWCRGEATRKWWRSLNDEALGEINEAIIVSDALALQAALDNHHAMVKGTRPHLANLYLTELQQVRSTALNLKTIQKIISQVNQNIEETQKELKRLHFLESAVAVQAAVRLQAWCRGEATRRWWRYLSKYHFIPNPKP